MRFGNTARVVTAVAMLFASCGGDGAATGPIDGLVAHFELDGDAADAEGANSGILNGSADAQDRTGADSGGLRFGEGDYIEIPHNDVLSVATDFTIAAWIRPHSGAEPGSFQTIFEKSDPERGGHSRYGLWLSEGQLWACFEAADSSRQPCAQTEEALAIDTWHHVAAVRSGRRLILYIDGAEAANVFVGLYEVSQTGHSAFIGTDRYQNPAEWLHATLDDVRLYNLALEPDEVAALADS